MSRVEGCDYIAGGSVVRKLQMALFRFVRGLCAIRMLRESTTAAGAIKEISSGGAAPNRPLRGIDVRLRLYVPI